MYWWYNIFDLEQGYRFFQRWNNKIGILSVETCWIMTYEHGLMTVGHIINKHVYKWVRKCHNLCCSKWACLPKIEHSQWNIVVTADQVSLYLQRQCRFLPIKLSPGAPYLCKHVVSYCKKLIFHYKKFIHHQWTKYHESSKRLNKVF